jgi:murein DD-endopeptidase MepM/ murein hydrolase activator NlpD
MAAAGTPVVAIVTGTITYAGYGSSAGNWLQLSGDDGNGYWYMHNQVNLVSGGRVSVGQQIATVGNTGNASGGPPHVHFEFHPGGGGPVNPYFAVVLNLLGGCATNRLHLTLVDPVPALEDVPAVADVR